MVDKNDPILGFFHRWLIEFAKHADQVDVICLKKGNYELPPHVHVHSLGKEEGESNSKYVVRFYRLMFNRYVFQHVDFVFFHMGAIFNILAAPFFFLRKIKRTKFIWWKTHGKLDRVGKLALWFVDEVVTAGSKSFAGNIAKVRVVGHAIDTAKFVDREHGVHEQARALMVGRITPIKKIDLMLPVVKDISLLEPDFKLSLIGTHDNADYEKSLRASMKLLGIEDRVSFDGARTQDELVAEYHRASFLLHPAYEAGFDKVVIEAMASGVIPLTSIPSFEPILSVFGLYVDKGAVSTYTSRVRELMELSFDAQVLLRKELRDIVILNHSISTLPSRIFFHKNS